MQIPILIYLICFALEISARKCGFPDKSDNTPVQPKKATYSEEEQVSYKCERNYYMIQDSKPLTEMKRTCQCNGIWSETVPGCNFRDYVNKRSQSTWNTYFSALDEDDGTYYTLQFIRDQYEIEITVDLLYTESDPLFVWILYAINLQYEAEISVIYSDGKTWWQCHPRNKPILTNTKSYLMVACYWSRDAGRPQTLKLKFSRTQSYQSDGIHIYTIRALGRTADKCVTPSQLHNGVVTVTQDGATYSCNLGYTLLGNNRSSCGYVSDNYYWFNEQTPICASEKEKACSALPEVEHGRLVFAKPTCPKDYNMHFNYSDTAVLHCDHGFSRGIANTIAHCNESTEWKWQLDAQPLLSANACLPPANSANPNKATTLATTMPPTPQSTCSMQSNWYFVVSTTLLAIGVVLTILCLLYCLYSYGCKKIQTRKTGQLPEELGNSNESFSGTGNFGHRRPTDFPLTVVNRITSNALSSPGESDIYAEIGQPTSTSPTSPFNPDLQSNATYAVVIPGTPGNFGDSNQDLYSNIGPLYSNTAGALKQNSSQTTPKRTPSVAHLLVNGEPYAQVVKSNKK